MSGIDKKIDEIREMKQKLERLQEAILIYSDAVDAATTQLRQNLGTETKPQGSPKLKFDTSKIVWKNAEGNRGPFEIAEKKANDGNPDYNALEQFLENAGGRVTSEGYFVWMFTDKGAIGRKIKQK